MYRGGALAAPPLRQFSRFSAWLDAVFRGSELPIEAVDEGWRLTVEHVLRIYTSVAARLDQPLLDDLFLKLVIRTMPERALERVLNSSLGSQVRVYVGDMLQPEVVWTIRQADGTVLQHAYPQAVWQRDYDRPLERVVSQGAVEPVVVGRVRIEPVGLPAAMWLRFRLAPAEQLAPGAPIGTLRFQCLFPYLADHRRPLRAAVWRIGRQQLAMAGITTQAWERIRGRLLAASPRDWRAAGRASLRHLVGHWPIVRGYLVEAVQLGEPAVFDILARIAPEDVRAWLGIPVGTHIDTARLASWAACAAGVALGGETAAAADVLRGYLAEVGHSLFLDGIPARERVVELIVTAPPAIDRAALVDGLLAQAQATPSTALKATIVRIVLQCHSTPEGGIVLDEATRTILVALIAQICLPLRPDDPATAPTRLINALIGYLYQLWRSTAAGEAAPLAYLAHMAASRIGELLAAHIAPAALEELLDALERSTGDVLLGRPVGLQPDGLFRPAWAGMLNYAAALLLDARASVCPTMAALLSAPAARSIALRCGVQHRVLQVALGTPNIAPTWLDTARVADLPQALASVLAEFDEGATATWSEIEQYQLVLCQMPEAGEMLLADTIARLAAEESDSVVLNMVGTVLLTLDQPGAPRAALVADLLAPEPLARIQRCPACQVLLPWRLTGVLVEPARFDAALVAARHALMTLPSELPAAAEVAALTTGVLAGRASQGQLLDELRAWVEQLGGRDDLPLPAARSALRMLLHWWPSMDRARDAIGPTLDMLAGMPRFARLWELRRLRERA